MDLRKLKTLIDLVSESGIAELEVTEAEGKVRIVRNTLAPPTYTVAAPAPMMQPGQTQNLAPPVTAPVVAPAPAGKIIKSPMVGTFYRASAPNSPPFVDIGTSIKEGDTVCIIEAMKLLNEVESDHAGVIKQILVESGQPVEYGQPLFVIE
jgi:acetyl-CoA carboxylase biotin carboxyl carrier protein